MRSERYAISHPQQAVADEPPAATLHLAVQRHILGQDTPAAHRRPVPMVPILVEWQAENAEGEQQPAADVNPLNTTEIQQIGAMGSKEIVDAFGADRILATLEAFKDPDLSLSGSPKQLANRLKFRIYPQA